MSNCTVKTVCSTCFAGVEWINHLIHFHLFTWRIQHLYFIWQFLAEMTEKAIAKINFLNRSHDLIKLISKSHSSFSFFFLSFFRFNEDVCNAIRFSFQQVFRAPSTEHLIMQLKNWTIFDEIQQHLNVYAFVNVDRNERICLMFHSIFTLNQHTKRASPSIYL